MRPWTPLLAGIVCVLPGCATAPPPGAAPQPRETAPAARTLYQRLGGYDALAAVTDDFLRRWLADPALSPYFANLDDDGKKRVRQMVVDQLCFATGGPCLYVGADMPTAHKDLRITDADWNTAVAHIVRTLDGFKVTGREMTEVLDLLASLKLDVINR